MLRYPAPPPATKKMRKTLQLSLCTLVDNRSGIYKAGFTLDEAANESTGEKISIVCYHYIAELMTRSSKANTDNAIH